LLVVLVVVVAGCEGGTVAPADMSLDVSNGTTFYRQRAASYCL